MENSITTNPDGSVTIDIGLATVTVKAVTKSSYSAGSKINLCDIYVEPWSRKWIKIINPTLCRDITLSNNGTIFSFLGNSQLKENPTDDDIVRVGRKLTTDSSKADSNIVNKIYAIPQSSIEDFVNSRSCGNPPATNIEIPPVCFDTENQTVEIYTSDSSFTPVGTYKLVADPESGEKYLFINATDAYYVFRVQNNKLIKYEAYKGVWKKDYYIFLMDENMLNNIINDGINWSYLPDAVNIERVSYTPFTDQLVNLNGTPVKFVAFSPQVDLNSGKPDIVYNATLIYDNATTFVKFENNENGTSYGFYIGAEDGGHNTYLLGGELDNGTPIDFHRSYIAYISNSTLCAAAYRNNNGTRDGYDMCALTQNLPSSDDILTTLKGKNWNLFIYKQVKAPDGDYYPFVWKYQGCLSVDENGSYRAHLWSNEQEAFIDYSGTIESPEDGQLRLNSDSGDYVEVTAIEIGTDSNGQKYLFGFGPVEGGNFYFFVLYPTQSCPF